MGLKNLTLQYLAVNVMSNCIKDLRHWMISNNLMINESNTKLLLKHLSVEDTLPLVHALVSRIYLFIIYLFIDSYKCTGERTIGHVVPYLVHPPNPIKCRKKQPLTLNKTIININNIL